LTQFGDFIPHSGFIIWDQRFTRAIECVKIGVLRKGSLPNDLPG
jgi:hypothetical protein